MNLNWLTRRSIGFSLIILLIFQLQAIPVLAQDTSPADPPLTLNPVLRFAHLNSDDGLVQNAVTSILQDRNGFMWFSTVAGISRYDGYNFITFQNDPNDINSLSQNYVRNMVEASDGMIWIATEGGGVNRLNPDTLTFTRYRTQPEQNANRTGPVIRGDRHLVIFEDSRGHIWAGGGQAVGLSDFDPAINSATFHAFEENNPDGLWGFSVMDIIQTDQNTLWFATGWAAARYDLNSGLFTSYDLRPMQENDLGSLMQDAQGNIWAGGRNGLYQYDAEADKFELHPLVTNINDMIQTADGIVSLATQRGLYRVDLQTMQITGHDEPYRGVPDSLNNSSLDVIYQDQAGKIWLGGDVGLDIYDPHLGRFDYFRTMIPGAPSTFLAGEITAVSIADESTAWFAVDSTLHKVDLRTQEVTPYRLTDFGADRSTITAIIQDHEGIVWLGNRQNHLWQFDPVSETFNAYPLNPARPDQPNSPQDPPPPSDNQPQRQPYIISLAEDSQNRLWVASAFGGLVRLDEARENITHYKGPEIPPPPTSPTGDPIRPPIQNISIDRSDQLWVTNLNGFYRFDPTTESYQRFILLRNGGDTWTESSIEDDEGIIWVAARDGLFRLNPETEEVKQYTKNDGLPTNSLVGILQDADGDLWISTKSGLSRFTPATETFRNYTVKDGLQGSEFNNRIFAQTPDGRMFFGGTNGLTAFYPQAIVDSTYVPPVIVDNFELFYESVQPGEASPLSKPIWLTDAITLNYDQNILTFEFAALNYAFGATNHYRYQLDGLQTTWNETDSKRRYATYTNLRAGDYTFRVQAANRDGVWSDRQVAISLTVLPPWWETAWFRLLTALSIVALIFGGYQWRVRQIQNRNRVLELEVNRQTQALQARTVELQTSEGQLRQARDAAEAANRAKSAFLANMSHELRSPLNAILGFTQLVNRNHALPPDVHENLRVVLRSGEHLLSLINQVLDLSKIEAGHMALNTTDFDLYRLLSDVEDMFILLADDKHLALNFDYADDVPQFITTDITKLRQTLINLISNALKFTTQGEVRVQVKKLSGQGTATASPVKLEFEVSDTGAGILPEEISLLFDAFAQTSSGRKAQEGTGLGLAISHKFVELMGGDIGVTSQVGQGTTFTFTIACKIAPEVDIHSAYVNQHIIGLAPGQPTYRVLVVDDKRTNRQLLVKLLQPLGFEVREAENGEQAVELAASFEPQIILIDIRMPVMGGLEATQHIRALPGGKNIKIVALTASVYDEERSSVLAAGCDDFVRKPFRTDTVFEILRQHIGVTYVYEADNAGTDVNGQDSLSLSELKSAITTVPASLLIRLSEAIELGDMTRIEVTIDEIHTRNPSLGDTLERMTQRFQFNELLLLLEEGEGA